MQNAATVTADTAFLPKPNERDSVMGKKFNNANLALREARAKGEKYYMPNFACPQGHTSKRVTSSTACYECSKNRTIEARKKLRYGPNAEEFRAKCKAERHRWIKKGGERVREMLRAAGRDGSGNYRKKNPINARVDTSNRRAKRLGIEGRITVQEISDLLMKQDNKCASCMESLQPNWNIDHIMPMRLKGLNKIENIQILCDPCNKSKGPLHPAHWALLKAGLQIP
jgi:hypothetical protein